MIWLIQQPYKSSQFELSLIRPDSTISSSMKFSDSKRCDFQKLHQWFSSLIQIKLFQLFWAIVQRLNQNFKDRYFHYTWSFLLLCSQHQWFQYLRVGKLIERLLQRSFLNVLKLSKVYNLQECQVNLHLKESRIKGRTVISIQDNHLDIFEYGQVLMLLVSAHLRVLPCSLIIKP